MYSSLVRYRFAMLLLWAALVLATNPVWHAIGHTYDEASGPHSSHNEGASEHGFENSASDEDLCVYCEGTFQSTEATDVDVPARDFVYYQQLIVLDTGYLCPNSFLNIKLRAPPFRA